MKDIKDRIIEKQDELIGKYFEGYDQSNNEIIDIFKELGSLKSQLHITTKDLQAIDQAREENNV